MRRHNVYAVYKGDEFLDLGTLPELEGRLGMPSDLLRFYSSPAWGKRSQGRECPYMVFKIGDDKDELSGYVPEKKPRKGKRKAFRAASGDEPKPLRKGLKS